MTLNNEYFITMVNGAKEKAAEFIKNMAGEYRFPELLKLLDQCTKGTSI